TRNVACDSIPRPEPPCTDRFGTIAFRFCISVTPADSSCKPESAVIASGTSCTLSSRRRALTITSSSTLSCAPASGTAIGASIPAATIPPTWTFQSLLDMTTPLLVVTPSAPAHACLYSATGRARRVRAMESTVPDAQQPCLARFPRARGVPDGAAAAWPRARRGSGREADARGEARGRGSERHERAARERRVRGREVRAVVGPAGLPAAERGLGDQPGDQQAVALGRRSRAVLAVPPREPLELRERGAEPLLVADEADAFPHQRANRRDRVVRADPACAERLGGHVDAGPAGGRQLRRAH